MNAMIPATIQLGYAEIERMGAAIAKSGLFGIRTADQAVALMMIAHAEGRHPALAARDYSIIQGKPSKTAEAMLRDFIDGGGTVRWHELTDAKADATFKHPQGGEVRISWDMARAKTAGLAGKDLWQKYPRQMLRSRCVSEGVRTIWPMATSGMYEAGEVADFSGQTIDAEPEAPKSEREQINSAVPLDPQPERRSWAQWAEALELAERDTPDAGVGLLLAKAEITEIYRLAKEGKPSPAKQRILDVMHRLEERYLADPPEPETPEEELPEIRGETNVMAGD